MLLKPEDYYTQRNNKLNPLNACMSTTRIMLYLSLGLKLPKVEGSLDDFLYRLLDSTEAKEFRDQKYPGLRDYHPTQIHGMYGSWLDEKLFNKRITDFKTNLTWEDFKKEIENGHAIMTSGKFSGLDGHAFLVCGYENGELRLSDPWGNYSVGYAGSRGKKGYDVRMNKEDFHKIVKPGVNKWGHVVL